ncbi:MAG: c-type cytochrome [Cyanobacteria bacterium P01_D01_bin.50]
MKKILSIVFVMIPLLFFTYACGDETQAKMPPVVQNVGEKTKTAIEEVEHKVVETVKDTKEEKPVVESTEVTTEEEKPVAETTEVTIEEEKPVAETTEVNIEEESVVEAVAIAFDYQKGSRLFAGNCAACHAGGKNLVNAMKTLKKDALEKYGMYSQEAIVYQVINGKNAMPAFGRRLSSEQIENLAGYVLAQADKGW